MAGIPFLSKILALAGIGVKEQSTNREVLVNIYTGVDDQPDGTTITVDLPTVSGRLPVLSQVVPASDVGQPNGVASLDAGGKVPSSQLPAYAVSEVFVVADQAARLALTAQVGDIAIQTDNGTTYILQTEPASVNSNWVVISSSNYVVTVNGESGPNVVIDAADVGAVALNGSSVMTGSLVVGPYGTGTGETGAIRLRELFANGTYAVSLRAPNSLADDVILTLPDSTGSGGQVLTTDGTGVLSWSTPSSGVTSITTLNGGTETGAVTITAAKIGAVAKAGDSMSGALTMGPTGLLPGDGGVIRFQELAANGSNYVAFRAPDLIGSDLTWTLPAADGSANQALTTNGSATLSWVSFAKSVNSQTPDGAGNVSLTTTNVPEGTNLYFTNTRAQDAITGAASTIVTADLTADRALVSNGSGKVAVSAVTATELGYLSGVSSAIQTQINGKVSKSGDTMSGALVMGPIGTAAGDGGIIKFQELAANGTNFVALRAADAIATDVTWTLPAADGTPRQALVTDGAGVLSWEGGLLYINYNGSTESVYSHVNPAVTPGQGNTAYGNSALNLSTGNYNTAIGNFSGASLTTGTDNTFIGKSSGLDMDGGSSENSVVGVQSLSGINVGFLGNNVVGAFSATYTGSTPASFSFNNVLGRNSLKSSKNDLTVQYNIVIGDNAARSLGNLAPAGALVIEKNIAIGQYAFDRGAGSQNIFIGDASGSEGVAGSSNTAIGNESFFILVSGSNNIALGANAGRTLGEGSYNTFIGGDCSTDVDGVVVIGKDSAGNSASASLDNQFILGVAAHRYQMPGTIETDVKIGASGGSNKALRFFDSGETHSVGLKAPSSLGVSTTYTLPASYGTTGQVLTASDNSGTLSWAAIPSAPVTSVNGLTGAVVVQTLVHPTTGSTFEYNTANVGMTGQSNTAIGVDAAVSLTSGVGNTAFGDSALASETTGATNTAIGFEALTALNSSPAGAGNNTAIGANSLKFLTSGTNNVEIGCGAISSFITSGNNNTIINASTLSGSISNSVAIGRSGTATAAATANNQFVLGVSDHRYYMEGRFESDISIGALSGAPKSLNFYDGDESAYVGFKAPTAVTASVTWTLPAADGSPGQILTTDGSGILSWGAAAGSLSHPTSGSTFELGTNNVGMTGTDNTAIGVNAGTAITTGSYNTFFGIDAGNDLTAGNDNTLIGAFAGEKITTGNDNTVIGSGALSDLVTGSQNIAIGPSGGSVTSGSYNTFIHGSVNTTGSYSGVVAIGADSGGIQATATASNQFVLGTSNHTYLMPGVVGTSLVLAPTGSLSGETGIIQLRELAANGSNYVAFRAPDALAADVTYTLPAADGSSGQVLTTNASGSLSWQTVVDTALTARVDKLEASRGIYSGNLTTGSTLNISSLVPTGAVEYPIVQVYKVESGVNLQINVEFSFDPATKVITFGTVIDGPISAVVHVLALTSPLTTLV